MKELTIEFDTELPAIDQMFSGLKIDDYYYGKLDRRFQYDPVLYARLKQLYKYYDVSIKPNISESKIDDSVSGVVRNLNSIEHLKMRELFDDYNNTKKLSLRRNYDVTFAIGISRSLWTIHKFFTTFIPRKIINLLYDEDELADFLDEHLGIFAGFILGTKYLSDVHMSVGTRVEKQLFTKQPKDYFDFDEKLDPLLDDMISNLISNPPEKYADRPETEDPYNVLTDYDTLQLQKEIDMLGGGNSTSNTNSNINSNTNPNTNSNLNSNLNTKSNSTSNSNTNTKSNSTSNSNSNPNTNPKIEILVNDATFDKDAVKTAVIQGENLLKTAKNEDLKSDPVLRGSYVGLMANKLMPNNLATKIKIKIHKVLCILSSKTKSAASLFCGAMNLILALIYVQSRLTEIVFDRYMKYRQNTKKDMTVEMLCEYVAPANRATFNQSVDD